MATGNSTNNVLGFCLGSKVTIDGGVTVDGGSLEITWPTTPLTVVLEGAVTIDPAQITSILDAIEAINNIDVNITNETIPVEVTNEITINAESFTPIIEALESMVVAMDPCACLLLEDGTTIQGTLILYGDGSTKFISRQGIETIDPPTQSVTSKCCKAKPYAFCKGCYEGQTGMFFYMTDYTVNFIDDDNPTNLVMNIDRSKIECKGCETDPCCCYEQGLMKIVHNQQVRATSLTFPAGAYEIDIRVDSPEPNAYILINGKEFLFNDRFNPKHQVNEVNNYHDFNPEVIIENPGGFSFEYTAIYPSVSTANLTGL